MIKKGGIPCILKALKLKNENYDCYTSVTQGLLILQSRLWKGKDGYTPTL
jgi:hypothetical protein